MRETKSFVVIVILIGMISFLAILFFEDDTLVFPQTTFMDKPIELTQEQKDWSDITASSTDTITAMKLNKKLYPEYIDKINKRQAIAQIQDRNRKRRKRLKIGHASHIYPCHIENEVKKIVAEDLAIKESIEIPRNPESGISITELLGIIAAIGGAFLILTKIGAPAWLSILIIIVALCIGAYVLWKKKKKKEKSK